MQFETSHREALADILEWRRDVRHFRAEPVAESDLEALRHAMVLAPSVGNSQPWRVVQVDDSDIRQRIIANHLQANSDAADIYDDERRAKYKRLKLSGLVEAPVQLAVFTEHSPSEGAGLGRQTMPETLVYSTILAIHNLWLTARARNLGVGWVSILQPDSVARCLDVPPSWRLTAYLCVGNPIRTDDQPELQRRGWQNRSRTIWQIK